MEVSLKILNSGLILKTFTHDYTMAYMAYGSITVQMTMISEFGQNVLTVLAIVTGYLIK